MRLASDAVAVVLKFVIVLLVLVLVVLQLAVVAEGSVLVHPALTVS